MGKPGAIWRRWHLSQGGEPVKPIPEGPAITGQKARVRGAGRRRPLPDQGDANGGARISQNSGWRRNPSRRAGPDQHGAPDRSRSPPVWGYLSRAGSCQGAGPGRCERVRRVERRGGQQPPATGPIWRYPNRRAGSCRRARVVSRRWRTFWERRIAARTGTVVIPRAPVLDRSRSGITVADCRPRRSR